MRLVYPAEAAERSINFSDFLRFLYLAVCGYSSHVNPTPLLLPRKRCTLQPRAVEPKHFKDFDLKAEARIWP